MIYSFLQTKAVLRLLWHLASALDDKYWLIDGQLYFLTPFPHYISFYATIILELLSLCPCVKWAENLVNPSSVDLGKYDILAWLWGNKRMAWVKRSSFGSIQSVLVGTFTRRTLSLYFSVHIHSTTVHLFVSFAQIFPQITTFLSFSHLM